MYDTWEEISALFEPRPEDEPTEEETLVGAL